MLSHPIPITTLSFAIPMHPGGLNGFRGAVVEKAMQQQLVFEAAGVPTNLFHNHDEKLWNENDTNHKLYRFPLVQYKVKHRKAELFGISEGAKALQLWLPLAGHDITISGKTHLLKLENHEHVLWNPTLTDAPMLYRLNKWLPFNMDNYNEWNNTPRLVDKAQLLDRILWGNIFNLAEGLGMIIQKEKLILYVNTIDLQTYKTSHRLKKLALDITFTTNFNLPDEIGLGQSVTLGFGKVQQIKRA